MQQRQKVAGPVSAVRAMHRRLSRKTEWEYASCLRTTCAVELAREQVSARRRRLVAVCCSCCNACRMVRQFSSYLSDSQMDELGSVSLLFRD